MLPLGGVLITLFAGWFMSTKSTASELGGEGALVSTWRFLARFVAPIGVLFVLADATGLLDIELHKGSMSKRFTTLNMRRPGESLTMGLIDGPFRHLEGIWHFDGVGDDGSKVSLHIDFEFSSPMLSLMFGSYFEQTCSSLVDAFTRRARQVYG